MNVKSGDLAIMVKAVHVENIGRIVHVRDFCGDLWGQKDVWTIEFREPTAFFNPESGERGRDTWLAAPDAWLRPVSGLPVEEYDRITEKEPA